MKKAIRKIAATTLSIFGILSAMPSAFCVPPKMDGLSDEVVFSISKGNIEKVEDPCKLEIIYKKYRDIIVQYNLNPSEIYTNCLVAIPNMGFYRVGGFKEGVKSIEKIIFLPGSFDVPGFWKVLRENGIINKNNEYSAQWKPSVEKDFMNNNRIVFRRGDDKIMFLFDSSNVAFHIEIRNSEPEEVVNPSLRDFFVPEFSDVGRPKQDEARVVIEDSSSDSEFLETSSSDGEALEAIYTLDIVENTKDNEFRNRKFIEKVCIYDSVDSIGESSFRGCKSLKSVYIPDSVTTIGKRAFENCTSLKEIIIPDFVTSIKERTFYWCTSLEKVCLSPNIRNIEKHAFESCCSLKELFLSDSVTSIEEGAFCDCQSLWRAYIPCSVTYIAKDAFKGCENLKSIVFDDKEYDSVDSFMKAFEDYQKSHIE